MRADLSATVGAGAYVSRCLVVVVVIRIRQVTRSTAPLTMLIMTHVRHSDDNTLNYAVTVLSIATSTEYRLYRVN